MMDTFLVMRSAGQTLIVRTDKDGCVGIHAVNKELNEINFNEIGDANVILGPLDAKALAFAILGSQEESEM